MKRSFIYCRDFALVCEAYIRINVNSKELVSRYLNCRKITKLQWTKIAGMYIYAVGQGSFISSVSPNGVHLIGISTEVLANVWGTQNRWLCCRGGLTLWRWMFIHVIYKTSLPSSQKTVCVHYKDQLINAVKGNNCYLLLESYDTYILYICGQKVELMTSSAWTCHQNLNG
jgi:hypothetical protein